MVSVTLFSTPVGQAGLWMDRRGLVAYRYQSRALGSRTAALRKRCGAA